jgi:hypothetical protein
LDEPNEELDKSVLPAVTAAASWMDTFKLPMREIKKKYTTSELVMMAWDSKQKAVNMNKMYKKPSSTSTVKQEYTGGGNTNGIRETSDAYEMPAAINAGVPIPKKWFNEKGEIALRQATGPQAVHYLNALGLNIAIR